MTVAIVLSMYLCRIVQAHSGKSITAVVAQVWHLAGEPAAQQKTRACEPLARAQTSVYQAVTQIPNNLLLVCRS